MQFKRSIKPQKTLRPNFFHYTFARHPFSRIVSTYQDKIVDKIYMNWRTKISGIDQKTIPDFPKFVDFVLAGKLDPDVHVMPFWQRFFDI